MAHADLHDVHLHDVRLNDADLTGADLTLAYLSGTHLEGAILNASDGLDSESIRCARVDDNTTLPPGVKRPMRDAPVYDPACRVH
ncbi:pentapeptide repeat-containing protein [Dactylosporangium matsuzakiense]|uniref:Pentapeptide repeat-containing protein n=1 Tax=Dactylosporangium matsuzakiense TaxID=53360 RepID=A0A9W6NS97_9ACTN|nr:pentapeptide repeat-containing protein [Dactylosporangium matsuzakiense]GLL08125.1 hypothetical protein GCM10017581_098850 [Dactylosporangium matsuzakiense]